ncbi:MAG: class I SAM-dependent RNA methyltransferase [Verrucomicrobiales bacterium]
MKYETPRGFRPFPFPYHAEIEVRIETLTNMGQGLARVAIPDHAVDSMASGDRSGGGDDGECWADGGDRGDVGAGKADATSRSGWVVLVPFALPGERVRVRIFRNQKNFSEADLVTVVEPSRSRVVPRCALFGTCGGCQYQHLAYADQLHWKRRQLVELLRHMAGVEFPVDAVIGSPLEYGYRSKITPHFAKPKSGQAGGSASIGEIGFLRAGTRSRLVDVPRCEIATDAVNVALAGVREAVRREPWRFKQGATLSLREDADGLVLTDPRAEMVSAVAAVGPSPGRPPEGVEWRFTHLAGDFFQNNPSILPAFVEYIVSAAAGSGARFLVDAYGGSGLFAVAAAGRFEQVAGVEISATAVEQARRNAVANRVTNATFLAASAEAIFADISFPPGETVVLIDPPRAGCSDEFLAQLVTFRPRCCVYVSCNPATQMRDLRQFLAAGYRVQAVQPFDLFPQTKHLECVLTLRPASM